MDQPGTSTSTSKVGQRLPQESASIGSGTLKLLQRILLKLELDKKSNISDLQLMDPITRAARYTGIHKGNIEMLMACRLPIKYRDIDREIIQKALVKAYLDNNTIPTLSELFDAVWEQLPHYVDIEYLHKILIKMGYAFYKFPGKPSFYIMEKKLVTFERYKYLKSIQHYRKTKAPIHYIGMVSFNRCNELLNLEQTIQTLEKNIIKYIFFVANSEMVKFVFAFTAPRKEFILNVQDWLLNMVLCDLPLKSIVILEDSKIFPISPKVPTWKSVKEDIVEWLEYNNIPCDGDMPKSELLDLVETCTDTSQNNNIVENLIKSHNHTLLRLPICIKGLSLAASLIDYINNTKVLKSKEHNVEIILKNVPKDMMESFSAHIDEEESRELAIDMQVDNVLDKLVRDMKILDNTNDSVTNEDDAVIPDYSDSD